LLTSIANEHSRQLYTVCAWIGYLERDLEWKNNRFPRIPPRERRLISWTVIQACSALSEHNVRKSFTSIGNRWHGFRNSVTRVLFTASSGPRLNNSWSNNAIVSEYDNRHTHISYYCFEIRWVSRFDLRPYRNKPIICGVVFIFQYSSIISSRLLFILYRPSSKIYQTHCSKIYLLFPLAYAFNYARLFYHLLEEPLGNRQLYHG